MRTMYRDDTGKIDEVGVQLLLTWFFDTTRPEDLEFSEDRPEDREADQQPRRRPHAA